MSWQRNHLFECFPEWWKISNLSRGLFVGNMENNRRVGYILGNQFHFLLMPAVCYTVNWQPFTSILIYSNPTACRFLFMLLLVLRTIFKCASWVILLVAALTASRLTNRCLRLLRANQWCIWCSMCQSVGFGSALTQRRCLCIHHLVVWNRRGRW